MITKAITGHVTEELREHSSVDLAEKRIAMANVVRLLPRPSRDQVGKAPDDAENG